MSPNMHSPLLLLLTLLLSILAVSIHLASSHTVKQSPLRVHLDVEPHALSTWDTDKQKLSNQYLDLLEKVRELLKGSQLPIAVDIPFWYDNEMITRNGETKSLLKWVLERVDRIMIMDYRNTADGTDGIITHAEKEIELAKEQGKQVIIGVETGDVKPEKITFSGKTAQYMEQELIKVRKHFENESPFSGIAIHDLKNWKSQISNQDSTENTIERDVFAWQTEDMIYQDRPNHKVYFDFLKQNKIRSIYVGCIGIMLREQISMARFLNETAENGWKVELLYGKHSWVEDPTELYELANKTKSFMVNLNVIGGDDNTPENGAHSSRNVGAIVAVVVLCLISVMMMAL